jgi:TetR/AcrR family transcriptional regulator, transcriptional repressor of aconitase
VPKISEERKTERREQILAGARRCFAQNGYEGATVARLETEIGLSRGAIFNYFGSKEDLFVALAVQDSARMSETFVEHGLEGVVREIVELDPDWLSVYLELFRRVRTDESFHRKIEDSQRAGAAVERNRARIEEGQRTGELRSDLEPKQIGAFLNLVLNGLALARAGGEEPPEVELVLDLLGDAIGGGARRDTRPRTPA